MTGSPAIPFVSVSCEGTGASTRPNELGMRPVQERAWERRGEQYLLIKSPPASGKSRALMFIALDKLRNQGLKQAIVAVPERTIGASFADARLAEAGFWADWTVRPRWNLCNAPGRDNGGKVSALKAFLDSGDEALVCTHATFRFAMERFGAAAFDGRLIAVDEFHHVSAGPDNRLGEHVSRLLARDKAHVVAMTGSYFRGDAEPVLTPEDEARFETVTYQAVEKLGSACQPAAEPQLGRRKVTHRLGDRSGSLLSATPFRLSKGFFNSLLYLLRAAQRLRASEAVGYRLLFLRWKLRRQHCQGT